MPIFANADGTPKDLGSLGIPAPLNKSLSAKKKQTGIGAGLKDLGRGFAEGATFGIARPFTAPTTTAGKIAEGVGNVGGTLLDLGIAPEAAPVGLAARVGRGALSGAGIGAIQGLTMGRGIVPSALGGAAVGAVGSVVTPTLAKAAGRAGEKLLSQEFTTPAAQGTREILRPWFNNIRRNEYRAGRLFKDLQQTIPKANYQAIIDHLTGESPTQDPAIAAQADSLRQFMDQLHQQANDAGVEIGRVENYFPRFYKEYLEEKPGASIGGKGMSPRTMHQRQRTLTEAESRARGDRATNVPAIVTQYFRNIQRAINNKKTIDEMRSLVDPETGQKVMYLEGHPDVPKSYVRVTLPRALQHGAANLHYVAKPEVAKYVEEIMGESPLSGGNWQKFQNLKNDLVGWKMMNPTFHAGNIVRALMGAGMKGGPVVGPIKALMVGAKLLRNDSPIVEDAVRHGLALEGTTWQIGKDIVDELMDRTSSLSSAPEDVRKLGLRQRLQNWLWNGAVRNAQVGLYHGIYERLAKQTAGKVDDAQLKRVAAEYANTVLGTMTTDFWSKSAKAAARTLLFAPKWSPSRLKIAGAGLFGRFMPGDLTPAARTMLQKEYKDFLKRSVGYTGAVITGLNLAIAHKPPWQNEPGHTFEVDITPLIGKDSLGRHQYLDLGAWVRDYIRAPSQPVSYAAYKTNPAISPILEDVGSVLSGHGSELPSKLLGNIINLGLPAVRDFPTKDTILQTLFGMTGIGGIVPGPKPKKKSTGQVP